MPERERLYVIDTSSLLDLRELVSTRNERNTFNLLTALVTAGRLFFPPEVYAELQRGATRPGSAEEVAIRWVRQVRAEAEKRADLSTVQLVLRNAPRLIDPDSPHEQADPYVVALGLDLCGEGPGLGLQNFGIDVTIVTEDRRDKPGIKMSVATAAGMVGLPSIPLYALLLAEG